jgi:predicted HTH transcriptional regulator
LYGWYGSYHEDSRQNSNLTDSDFIVRRKAVAYFLLLEEKELKEKLSKLTKRATRQIPQTQYRLAEIAKNLKALTLYPITK